MPARGQIDGTSAETKDRIVDGQLTDEEQGLDTTLRPQTLDEYVGQT